MSYKEKKVITIGIVSELTNLSERQIRYYESRKLIFPERSEGGTRKYSFSDVEKLIEISSKIKKGNNIEEIQEERKQVMKERLMRDSVIRGQLNSRFGIKK